MSANFANLLYLIVAVASSWPCAASAPDTSRAGNRLGMAGMAIAIVATLLFAAPSSYGSWVLILAGIAIGGGIGAIIAKRIAMTAMPQLVAAFHSLVGLAAVLVAAAALYAPQAFGIGIPGDIQGASLIEMSLGVAIGAVDLHRLDRRLHQAAGAGLGRAVVFPGQHAVNLGASASRSSS